jgi:hypothetical protein
LPASKGNSQTVEYRVSHQDGKRKPISKGTYKLSSTEPGTHQDREIKIWAAAGSEHDIDRQVVGM